MEAFLVLVILKGSEDDDSSSSSPRIPPPDSTSLLLECRRYGEPLKKLMLLSQERWHRQISQFTLFSPLIHHTHHFTTTDSEIRVPKKKKEKKKKPFTAGAPFLKRNESVVFLQKKILYYIQNQ